MVRHLLLVIAAVYAPVVSGCAEESEESEESEGSDAEDCEDTIDMQTRERSEREAVTQVANLARPFPCGSVCTSSLFEQPSDTVVDVCSFDTGALDLECRYTDADETVYTARAAAGSIGPEHFSGLGWTDLEQALQGTISDTDSTVGPVDSEQVQCELVLGASLLEQSVTCTYTDPC